MANNLNWIWKRKPFKDFNLVIAPMVEKVISELSSATAFNDAMPADFKDFCRLRWTAKRSTPGKHTRTLAVFTLPESFVRETQFNWLRLSFLCRWFTIFLWNKWRNLSPKCNEVLKQAEDNFNVLKLKLNKDKTEVLIFKPTKFSSNVLSNFAPFGDPLVVKH